MRESVFLLLALFVLSCTAVPEEVRTSAEEPQNVVFFIADGCGQASFSLARDFQREMDGIPHLALDRFEQGSAITFAEGSRITDSAASATAYACGVKTLNGRIAMTADAQPVSTVLEKAEAAGYNTALISTSRITHATPAAFSSHVERRSMETQIADQQLTKDIEILMGGGRQFYVPIDEGGRREDGRNLIEEAEAAGYHRADNRADLMAVDALPLIALFTASHMAYELDRDPNEEPSLAEMTAKSLELLGKADEPFFIMIEAGRIDHAGHGNDTAAHLWDVLAYDEAWQAAIEFATQDGNTLVLGTSDHETGGLTIGAQHEGPNGSGYRYDPTRLSPITGSVEAFRGELAQRMANGGVDMAWFRSNLSTRFNIDFASIADPMMDIIAQADTNASAADSRLQWLLTGVMADSARIGWSTGGHTAVNVPIFAYGPGSSRFKGTLDNTEVGIRLQEVLGLR